MVILPPAAVLSVKLKHLDNWNQLRHSRATLYSKLLTKIEGIQPPFMEEFGQPSFNYYTIRIEDSRLSRSELRNFLESRGIQTMVYYPLSLHLQGAYRNLGYKEGDFPESERAQEQVISLPMYAELSLEQVQAVVESIEEFVISHK